MERLPATTPASPLRARFLGAAALARSLRAGPIPVLALATAVPVGARVEIVVHVGEQGGCLRARAVERTGEGQLFEVDARDRWVLEALLADAGAGAGSSRRAA